MMTETDEDKMARLELLSSTALLKSKEGHCKQRKEDEKKIKSRCSSSRYSSSSSIDSRSGSPSPLPKSLGCLPPDRRGGESPSPESIETDESDRDEPSLHPDLASGYSSFPPHRYYSGTDTIDSSGQSVEVGSYSPQYAQPSSVYIRGVHHQELHGFSLDKTSSSRRPYNFIKENVPPSRNYQNPSMYGSVFSSDIRRAAISPEVAYYPVDADGVRTKDQQGANDVSYQTVIQENHHLHEQLKQRDYAFLSLQHHVSHLESQINELRSLPTGKISHIPIDEMLTIMETYGSEVSKQTLPQRRTNIKKASVVRQFRRWNPEFFRYFAHINGEWIPRLGKEGELERRKEKRKAVKEQNGNC